YHQENALCRGFQALNRFAYFRQCGRITYRSRSSRPSWLPYSRERGRTGHLFGTGVFGMWRNLPRWLAAFTVMAVYSAGSWAWAQQTAGVYVDAEGVLRKQEFDDPGGQLTKQRI